VTPPRRPSRSWFAFVGSRRGFLSLRGGVTRLSSPRSQFVLGMSLLLMAAALGCGQSAGVSKGATVSVYAAAPLCAEAERELARHEERAGDVRVRVSCLPSAESSRKLILARIGANARQATEDSSAIAYIGEPTRAASRFSETILEEAGIAQLPETPGAVAMRKLLRAVDEAGKGNLRQSVRDQVE